jgi:hypothetical protein
MSARRLAAIATGLVGIGILGYAVVQRDEALLPAAYLLIVAAIVVGLLGGRLARLLGRTTNPS